MDGFQKQDSLILSAEKDDNLDGMAVVGYII